MEGGGALPVYRCDTPGRLPQPEPRHGDHPRQPGVPGAGGGAAARSRRCGAHRHRAARTGARAGEPHHAPGLPGGERGGGLPGRGDRPGDGRARGGRGARRDAGLDHGPPPHGRGARRDARHRRRRAVAALARGAAVEPGGARPAPPPGPPAAQHGARRRGEAAPDRDRAGRAPCPPISARRWPSRAAAPGPGRGRRRRTP